MNELSFLKTVLDNGFGVFMSIVLSFFLFYIIKNTITFIDQRENNHRSDMKEVLSKFRELSEKNTSAIDKITDAFENYINYQKNKTDAILQCVSIIDQKVDTIINYEIRKKDNSK